MPIQFQPNFSLPDNNLDNFPVGQEFILLFDQDVDLKTFKESFVVFGQDFDRTSGPHNALTLDKSSGLNPFFLRSPEFKGFLDYEAEKKFIVELSKDNLQISDNQIQLTQEDAGRPVAIFIKPKMVLKEESQYELFLVGNNVDNLTNLPDAFTSVASANSGVSRRTIFDPYKDVNSVKEEQTSRIKSKGSYRPANNENAVTCFIKIITAGEGSNAEYKFWFSDESEPSLTNPATRQLRVRRCTGRWRSLDRGVLVRFLGGEYSLDEEFKIECQKKEFMETSFYWKFQTGSGNVFTIPENTSTSPVGLDNLIIPGNDPSVSTSQDQLRVISISPSNGDINQPLNLNQIVIEFNADIDPASVTQERIKLLSYPVSGSFDGPADTRSDREYQIYKIISVEDNKIILEL